MGYIAKLVKGTNTLIDFSTGNYRLAADFTPPTIIETPQIATGAGNNQSGGELAGVSRTAQIFAFNFNILHTTTVAEVERAIQDVDWALKQAGDENEPLYFVYRSDNLPSYAPLWGQAERKLEILHGQARKGIVNWHSYAMPFANIELTVKPFVSGQRQILLSAKGGVFEDTIGTTNRISRGLRIPYGTVNKFTNPVFGHATWNTGWTAAAAVIATKCTDKNFIALGPTAAKLMCNSAITNTFTQSINVGNTNTHCISCYAKKIDGSAISNQDIGLYYSASLTTEYVNVGNGFYRLRASVTGVNAARNVGVELAGTRTIFVSAFQVEDSFYSAPGYGDMLGWSWTGTAHASTSTRAEAFIKSAYANLVDSGAGAIRMWVKWWMPSTWSGIGGGQQFFDTRDAAHSNTLAAYFSPATDTISMYDGTNLAISAAQTFGTGTLVCYHFVWGPSGMAIYKDGVSIATGSYTIPLSPGTNLYLGSYYTTGGLHLEATIMDFQTFDHEMTAAEALADYNNLAPLLADDKCISPIPWEWDKDGDGIIDSYYDSTHADWCVVGGIPGSLPGEVLAQLTNSAASNYIIVGNNAREDYINPGVAFIDLSGAADATALGAATEIGVYVESSTDYYSIGHIHLGSYIDLISERKIYLWVCLKDVDSNLLGRITILNGSTYYSSDYQALATAATLRTFLIGPLLTSRCNLINDYDWLTDTLDPVVYLGAKRTTGGGDINIDYFRVLIGDVAILGTINNHVVIDNGKYFNFTATVLENTPKLLGDPLYFYPGLYNQLNLIFGINGGAIALTGTVTINRMYVTPRWAIQ